MTDPSSTTEWRTFGLSVDEVTQRLSTLPYTLPTEEYADGCVGVQVPLQATDEVAAVLGAYVYSRTGESLAARVVALLRQHGKTVATAESCTGGMIAAALTAVPGSSAVIGTGVVSYSCACKENLLQVSGDTIATYGVVSQEVAGEMARGVRHVSGGDIGVSVTGEAGPVAAGDQPVGTVCIGLADAHRTWTKTCHLAGDGRDREEIRRVATATALDWLRRYMEAYPAVMAGGVSHRMHSRHQATSSTKKASHQGWLWKLIPRRGDSRRQFAVKMVAWLSALAVLLCGVGVTYIYLLAPDTNRRLQESLGDLYWGAHEGTTGTGYEDTQGQYPAGMMATFRGLYERNREVAGWLRIPDTTLDYPVMYYADGYYQSHSFDGQSSAFGQPYVGQYATVERDGNGAATVVYGRNPDGEQMFAPLLHYRRLAFLREHNIIEFNTLYHTAQYEIFAVMVVDEEDTWTYEREAFADDKAFLSYMDEIMKRSLYRTDGVLSAEDKLLLLSTEAEDVYGFEGARLVVAARQLTDREPISSYHIHSAALMPKALTSAYHPSVRRTTTTTATAVTSTTLAIAPSATQTAMTTTTTTASTTSTTDLPTTTTTTETTAQTTRTTATTTTVALVTE